MEPLYWAGELILPSKQEVFNVRVRLLNLMSSAGLLVRAFVCLAYIRFHKVRSSCDVGGI